MSEPQWSDDLGPGAAHPDVAGWLLGALDPTEQAEFATHLDTCEPCRDAVRELGGTRAMLTVAAPPVELPPGLAARTLRAVELAAVQDLSQRRRQRQRRTTRWLAAAAAVVVLGGGGATFALQNRQPSGPTVNIAMKAPEGGAATGTATGHDTDNGWSVMLSVKGLPPIPAGQGHYECWYITPDDSPAHPDAVSAGGFEVTADGTATDVHMWTTLDLHNVKGVKMVITREPDNNPARTGPVVLSGPVTPN